MWYGTPIWVQSYNCERGIYDFAGVKLEAVCVQTCGSSGCTAKGVIQGTAFGLEDLKGTLDPVSTVRQLT
jgi:hypothetical protein